MRRRTQSSIMTPGPDVLSTAPANDLFDQMDSSTVNGVLRRCAAILGFESVEALERAYIGPDLNPSSFYSWACTETIQKFSEDDFLFALERPTFAFQMLCNLPLDETNRGVSIPVGTFGLHAFTTIGAYMHPLADFLTARPVFESLAHDSPDHVRYDAFNLYVDSIKSILSKTTGPNGEKQKTELGIPSTEEIYLRDGKKKSPVVWYVTVYINSRCLNQI